jgi:hypothetical protein
MLSTYQSDAAASLQLSAEERLAAQELKALRPEVYPGTRAILDRTAAVQWFDKVTESMRAFNMDSDPRKVAAFCDLAGVPD